MNSTAKISVLTSLLMSTAVEAQQRLMALPDAPCTRHVLSSMLGDLKQQQWHDNHVLLSILSRQDQQLHQIEVPKLASSFRENGAPLRRSDWPQWLQAQTRDVVVIVWSCLDGRSKPIVDFRTFTD